MIIYEEYIWYITMFNNRLNHHSDVQIDQGTVRHVLDLFEIEKLTQMCVSTRVYVCGCVYVRERERVVVMGGGKDREQAQYQ